MANDVKIQDVKTISISKVLFKVLYYLRLRRASTPKRQCEKD